MNFEGKVVLISGATGGMGREIALNLSKKGCKLALFARRIEHLKEIDQQIKKTNSESIYNKCNVKIIDDIKKAVELTKKSYGRIDVGILTAGVLVPNPIQTFDGDIIKDSMDINFIGNVYFIQYLLPIMKTQQSGIIAVTATLPDRRGVPGWGAYGASKAAVSWLMESLRAEGKKRYNIDFITIKPGSVLTPMIKGYHRRGAITAEKAAKYIINGIEKGKKIIQFPISQVLMTRTMDKFPVKVYDSINIESQKGDDYPEIDEE
jgi:NAD(P)-dependent dehydrogenase (short-subunit alcohol dehydrogenase family)